MGPDVEPTKTHGGGSMGVLTFREPTTTRWKWRETENTGGDSGGHFPEISGGDSCSRFTIVVGAGTLVALTFRSAPRTGLTL